MGQTYLIVFAFHLPALMETILISALCCHLYCKPSQVENVCISHFYLNKSRQQLHKDGEIIFLLLIEPDVDKTSTMKTLVDGRKKNQRYTFLFCLMKVIFLSLQWSEIQHINIPFFVVYTFYTPMVICISSCPLSVGDQHLMSSLNLLKPSIFLNIAVNMLQGHRLVFKPAYMHTYKICIL